MCQLENWSVRQLTERPQSMLYERTTLSKKPEETDLSVTLCRVSHSGLRPNWHQPQGPRTSANRSQWFGASGRNRPPILSEPEDSH
jgi:hypothetical protein